MSVRSSIGAEARLLSAVHRASELRAGQVALHWGADDFGGTLFEENVHAAADYVNKTTVDEIVILIREAGFTPVQRTTEYEIIKVY